MDVDQLRDSITGMFYGCIIGILTQFTSPSSDLDQANMHVNCVRCATPPDDVTETILGIFTKYENLKKAWLGNINGTLRIKLNRRLNNLFNLMGVL